MEIYILAHLREMLPEENAWYGKRKGKVLIWLWHNLYWEIKSTKWWFQMNYSAAWDFQEESYFWILRQWGQRDISVSIIRKKVYLRMKNNLWLQRERADSKIFELIKEIQGCSLVSTFCRHISRHLCLFPRRCGWFILLLIYHMGMKDIRGRYLMEN